MTYRPGDTVQLASGGPVLTVAGVDGCHVTCSWVTSAGHLAQVVLHAAAVRPATPEPGHRAVALA